jgi:nucleoside-diphosphate-sugar epimerase
MKVLLIGATGQIGYALANALSRTDHQTSVLVRNTRTLTFPGNINVLESKEFTADPFSHALSEVECVIYGIGLPEQFSFDDQLFQRTNYDLFKTFLDALGQSAVRRLVYISTYEVFESVAGVIRETHPIADPGGVTPYFKAMIQAYQLAIESAKTMNLNLTTIHPAAVYGGLNTGDGFTRYIENLLNWRIWKTPVIINGQLPLIHADSLAGAIVESLEKPGAFIVSDQMTSLREIALRLREETRSYIPPTVPLPLAYASTSLLEFFARRLHIKPIMARVQLEFITKGWEPQADRAQRELGWQPLSLRQGIQKYLKDRMNLPRQD